MIIKRALILCAGLGTRMGPVGTILPKPLWPVFEKPLLELQISLLKKLGIKEIYINSHHLASMIEKFVLLKDDISLKVIYEKEILGVGGAIHNVAQLDMVNYSDYLLVVNSDQFLLEGFEKLKNLSLDGSEAAFLFSAMVPGSDYNSLLCNSSGQLVNIIQNSDTFVPTYSGLSLINLNKLEPKKGNSSFFDSVADYKKKKILVSKPLMNYWDFGTLKQYIENHFKIIEYFKKEKENDFINFLKEEEALDDLSLSSKKYELRKKEKTIILGDAPETSINGTGVFYKDKVSRL